MKRVLVPLANGFEEIEAITIIDILRRAGAQVVTVGLEKRNVIGSHDIKVVADDVLAEVLDADWDLVVLPGGVPGTPNLAEDARLIALLQRHAAEHKLTAAICAAPAVLDGAGVAQKLKLTSHPGWADRITTAVHTGARVEEDGFIITGQAAGSALEFSFKLVQRLFGDEKVAEVNASVLAKL